MKPRVFTQPGSFAPVRVSQRIRCSFLIGQRGTFLGYVTAPDQEGRDYCWQMTLSKEVVDMMRLAPLLFISMVVAIPGLLVLRFVDSPMPIHVTMFATIAVWLVLLVAALVIHGRRGLWLLVGAPFALFIPLLWAHLYFVCQYQIGDFSITDPEQLRRLNIDDARGEFAVGPILLQKSKIIRY